MLKSTLSQLNRHAVSPEYLLLVIKNKLHSITSLQNLICCLEAGAVSSTMRFPRLGFSDSSMFISQHAILTPIQVQHLIAL